jgi:hypothetical protein
MSIKQNEDNMKNLEKKIKDLSVKDEYCDWKTVDGKRCRKQCSGYKNDYKFCNVHIKIINDYEYKESTDTCETYKDIKIIPRSNKQVHYFMQKQNNEDDIVEVMFAGGAIEEADITNREYISLVADDERFYYNPDRGDRKAKELRIIAKDYCKNESCVIYNDTRYCEDCYKKLKGVPKISLIS